MCDRETLANVTDSIELNMSLCTVSMLIRAAGRDIRQAENGLSIT